MRRIVPIFALAALSGLAACQPASETKPAMQSDTTASEPQTAAQPASETDPRLWLEEIEGPQALAWVETQNARTLARLQADPHYQSNFDQALAIANASDKIPYGAHRGGYVYNFWQDSDHVHGLWRRTPMASYVSGAPQWETLLDLDSLSNAEGENWVYKGVDCLPPEYERCIITLSRGGKDAAVRREFDIASKRFVKDGFIIPEAKGGTAWEDEDTVLVGTDWGPGSMTSSGYPFVLKRWQRGTALADAQEVLRGEASDVGVWPARAELDGRPVMFAVRAVTFYESQYYWLPESGEPVQMPVPAKSDFQGVYKDQAVFSLDQDWTPDPGGPSFKKGALVSFSLADFLRDKTIGTVHLVVQPDARSSIESAETARSALIVNMLQNVKSHVYAYDFDGREWRGRALPLPENSAITISSSNRHSDIVFANVESFLRPDALWYVNLEDGTTRPVYTLPERFDSSGLTVAQYQATSKDGTKVPYFIVHRQDMKHDGSTPTLLYGYGGFAVSMRPSYSGILGKLWLEKGGTYVLANIRGGGEFGPQWHQAGLKTHRQRIYDDFIAVAEDLIARKITSPAHLGIRGGSNGGLLMGVMYTQRPDLWNAVLCQVPLLDMMRYDKLLAGASWMGEYGDPADPVEGAFLRSISPYHNVGASRDYPEIFLMTSTKDDRVHPGHARKFAKLLQDYGKPFLYYENTNGGHSAAANLKETARREALGYTWLMQKLGSGRKP